ncbi:hypothetical protein JD844_000285 [Phrynosoma platyrhinos]|uniref:NTF2 domain-containing protein n=2 Tax=Sauria TaxID=32561 RepID=A0ABQ7SQL1_PHRPL|nr:hypothetical protein JD844_000285 [Phrynosoma platyrhinos]
MGDKPIWEQIGSSFVQHYYQLFDTDRTQLGAIYVSSYWDSAELLKCIFILSSQADEDPIMGFHQIFLLKNINDAWVCTNDMFRLALHNFG